MANNFKLTLDTLAPEGSITRPSQYLNNNATLAIEKGDATHMKVWFDTKAKGDKADVAAQAWEVAAESKETAFNTDGTYYYHLLLKDDVANESVVYDTQAIVFDKTLPVVDSFVLSDLDGSTTITNARTINYELQYSDNLAGVTKAYISGADIEDQELTLEGNGTKTGTITILNSAEQGKIDVQVKLVDYAGNESEVTTTSIILDTEIDAPVLVLETADNKVLPAFINYHTIQVELSSADKDIVGYKIWEGTTEPAEFTKYTPGEALFVEKAFDLSAGDGKKTVYAKVIDNSGTTAEAVAQVVDIDTVKPNVSLTASKALISAIEGYSESVLTMSGTDAYAKVKSYTLKVGDTVLSSGAEVPASYTVQNTDLVEGDNTIVLTVVDNAENVETKSVVIELDITKPVIDIPQLNTWYTAEFSTNLSYTEKNDIAEIYAWSNDKDVDTAVPADARKIGVETSPMTIAASDIKWGLIQSDKNYLHIKVMDEVGNVSYIHRQFGYDSVAPTGTVAFEKTVYGGQSAKINITYTDATSGTVSMKVKGDIKNPSTDWEAVASTRDVTLSDGDGQKEVQISFKDAAGNESDWFTSTNKAELDQSAPGVSMVLYKADGETLKPGVSAEAVTVIELTVTDDVLGLVEDSNVEYRVWGDFDGADENKWEKLTLDAGTATKKITVTVTNANAEFISTKTFNVQIKDAAGNKSSIETASFRFDPTAPTAEVKNLDHNRISKVHVDRYCVEDGHETVKSYADEVKFVIKPSEVITEWKVCAYMSEEAALAGSADDAAIGKTNGSENMTGTTNSSNEISCMIRGADYETALGEAGKVDGLHYVVVYVKNEAGAWSAKYIKA